MCSTEFDPMSLFSGRESTGHHASGHPLHAAWRANLRVHARACLDQVCSQRVGRGAAMCFRAWPISKSLVGVCAEAGRPLQLPQNVNLWPVAGDEKPRGVLSGDWRTASAEFQGRCRSVTSYLFVAGKLPCQDWTPGPTSSSARAYAAHRPKYHTNVPDAPASTPQTPHSAANVVHGGKRTGT